MRLIKVDVEGMEEAALRGAASTIGRFRPLLYVENDRPEKSDSLVRHIDSLGYRMYWHRPALFNGGNFAENPDNVFEGVASHNMLCVHRSVRHEPGGARARSDLCPRVWLIAGSDFLT